MAVKKFAFKMFLFLAIQFVIATIFLANYLGQNRYGYMAAFDDKIELLKLHSEPSIILLGGSNVAFGINSPLMEDNFNRPVINTGLQGGLGLDLYLSLATRFAQKGDIVILMPEWGMLSGHFAPKPLPLQQLLRESPTALQYISPSDEFNFKTFLDTFALAELASAIQNGTKYRSEKTKKRLLAKAKKAGMYSRLNFDHHGDFVGHHGAESDENIEDHDCVISFSLERYQEAIERINGCAEALRKRGVHLYLAYPPTPDPFFERFKHNIVQADEFLRECLNVPVLHAPQDSRFPCNLFFDTPYHLTEHGKNERTNVLIRAMSGDQRIASRLSSNFRK